MRLYLFLQKLLRGEEKEQRHSPLRLPNVTYTMPDVRQDMWKCNRCGSPVFDGELELHASFHKTQDTLLEKMTIALEKFEDDKTS